MSKIISIKNYYKLSNKQKNDLIDDIFCSKRIHDNKINSPGVLTNFEILRDRNNICEKIYEKILKTLKRKFGNFEIALNNKKTCHSLCTNKEYWASVPHDHAKTSTINSVFYLQIPKIDGKYCGKILFLDDGKWESYQPEPFELIIMPNYLVHDTEYHDTDEWRISLNFEVTCKNNINWRLI